MSLPRFRIRALMILVAVSACLVWAGIAGMHLRTKSQRYRALARQHAAEEANAQAMLDRQIAILNTLKAQIAQSNDRDKAAKLAWRANEQIVPDMHHFKLEVDRATALKRSYERLARRPWLPVPPDPPDIAK